MCEELVYDYSEKDGIRKSLKMQSPTDGIKQPVPSKSPKKYVTSKSHRRSTRNRSPHQGFVPVFRKHPKPHQNKTKN